MLAASSSRVACRHGAAYKSTGSQLLASLPRSGARARRGCPRERHLVAVERDHLADREWPLARPRAVVVRHDVRLADADAVVVGDPGLDRPVGTADALAVGDPLLAVEWCVAVGVARDLRRRCGELR